MLKKLVEAALIETSIEETDKSKVLAAMLNSLVTAGRFPAKHLPALEKRLLAREELGSTGIGNGIAVPHVKSAEVDTMTIIIARLGEGIEYEAIDGRPVQGIFMIVAPQDATEEHLQALRWVSSLARSADFRRFLGGTVTDREIRDLLVEMLP